MFETLLNRPLPDLMAEAAERRDSLWGKQLTYSPKVFIPLTRLCRDSCDYCTFVRPPARLEAAYLTIDDVLVLVRRGLEVGCTEALFTLGENPELRYTSARRWLEGAGHASTVDYLISACRAAPDAGLLPHANGGALLETDFARLKEVSASQGMMLESLAPDLLAHRRAPDKTPERRLAALEAAGRAQVPFTTGILVGIGETSLDRLQALQAIADSHQRHGHISEVIVQNFLPKPQTVMRDKLPASTEEHLRTIAVARLILPVDVHLQAPPNLAEDFGRLLDAGIDDWGGVSPVTADHVNPERPWPTLERLEQVASERGFTLTPRLPVYPGHARRPWVAEHVLTRLPVIPSAVVKS